MPARDFTLNPAVFSFSFFGTWGNSGDILKVMKDEFYGCLARHTKLSSGLFNWKLVQKWEVLRISVLSKEVGWF